MPEISSKSIEDKVNAILRNQAMEDNQKMIINEQNKKSVEKPVPEISSKSIEDKVNAILSNQNNQTTIENKQVVEYIPPKPVIETQPKQETIIYNPPKKIVEQEITTKTENKPTISLDDVSDEEFFDDFFEE